MTSRGFTLIEAVIYLALLGLMMASVVTVSYQLAQSANNLDTKNTLQEEGNFIIHKIAWALTGLRVAPIEGGSGCSQTLHTELYGGSTVDVRRAGTRVEMRENSSSYVPITTNNISVSCLKFQAISGTPAGVAAIGTINNVNFSVTKYLRI